MVWSLSVIACVSLLATLADGIGPGEVGREYRENVLYKLTQHDQTCMNVHVYSYTVLIMLIIFTCVKSYLKRIIMYLNILVHILSVIDYLFVYFIKESPCSISVGYQSLLTMIR